MNKQSDTYFIGILLCIKKKENAKICFDIHKLWVYYAI